MTQIIDQNGFTTDRFTNMIPVPLADYADGGALLLSVEDDLAEIANHFGTLTLIVVPFTSSADGRGFSMAAELRAFGYLGHLRAQGHILVDQLRAAIRCGFDDIEISDDQAARNPDDQWQDVVFGKCYRDVLHAPKDLCQ